MTDNNKRGVQKRSLITQEKIVETAKQLFCEKGFHNVTTNEIAKVAHVSIGTLYHYYRDKEAILAVLLERNNEHFNSVFSSGELTSDKAIKVLKKNPKEWLKQLVETLISLHESDLDFIKEVNVLYYTNDSVRKQIDEHTQLSQQLTYEVLQACKADITVKDLEALAIVSYGFISSLVDQMVFYTCPIEKERCLELGIDLLAQMLERLIKQ